MTSFSIEKFESSEVSNLKVVAGDERYRNWPVVYMLSDNESIYVGETLNFAIRMNQHLSSEEKRKLTAVRIILDDTFNKSVCLDLESYLIGRFAGDGKFKVLNRNDGITNAEYFDRHRYRKLFDDISENLRQQGLFQHSLAEIENSHVFKLSPFKALNMDQLLSVRAILSKLLNDRSSGRQTSNVISGDPGTGKTVIAVFLMKLIREIAACASEDDINPDSPFVDFFTSDNRQLLADLRVGLVIPQQSLRASVRKVFKLTPRLNDNMVLDVFQVGESTSKHGLLIVDETHRLNHRANQSSGAQNKRFAEINKALFGHDSDSFSQLDWIYEQSENRIFLLDSAQSVRPSDLPMDVQQKMICDAKATENFYELRSQMRVKADRDYVTYIRDILSERPPQPREFVDYDLKFYDDFSEMRSDILLREAEVGLSRVIAGFAWPWQSKRDKTKNDIEIGGIELKWNSTDKDWINSKNSINEVGSIHTVQGYDLNYAGVVIGPELCYDSINRRFVLERQNYFDTKGKENNARRGIIYDDDAILMYVKNIYGVLLTRGICGTYLYVCDPELRNYLRQFVVQTNSRIL